MRSAPQEQAPTPYDNRVPIRVNPAKQRTPGKLSAADHEFEGRGETHAVRRAVILAAESVGRRPGHRIPNRQARQRALRVVPPSKKSGKKALGTRSQGATQSGVQGRTSEPDEKRRGPWGLRSSSCTSRVMIEPKVGRSSVVKSGIPFVPGHPSP